MIIGAGPAPRVTVVVAPSANVTSGFCCVVGVGDGVAGTVVVATVAVVGVDVGAVELTVLQAASAARVLPPTEP